MGKVKYYSLFLVAASSLLGGANVNEKSQLPTFDMSLGKGDSYFNKYYKQCFVSLRDASTTWGGPEMRSSNEVYKFINFCRKLYESNKEALNSVNRRTRIPRVVHQIWLGSPFPEQYKHWQKTWQSMPGWSYKLWTDKDIDEFNLVNKDMYEASTNYGQRSDIARVEILNRFGGLYVDVDFECVNPEFFTMLNKAYDFYTGVEPLDIHRFSINNALIGSVPGHAVLKGYIKELRKRWHVLKTGFVVREKTEGQRSSFSRKVVNTTGPVFFTSIVKRYINTDSNDIILPPTFFYPLPYHFKELWDKYDSATEMKENILKPESAALHWWRGSWKQPSAFVNQNKR